MEPINYIQQQVNPMANLLQGLQTGAALRQVREQAIAQDEANALKKQFKTDLADYQTAPSSDKLLNMQIKYPQMSEAFKPMIAKMDAKQLESELSSTNQVLTAIKSGKPDVALSMLDTHIAAMDNSGIDSSKLKQIRSGIEANPEGAAAIIEFQMANIMGPEKYSKFIEAQGKAGEEARKAELFPVEKKNKEAEEQIKATEAKFAEKNALADLEKKGWDVENVKNQIWYRKAQNQIAAINAATSREGNAIKRQELGLKLREKQIELNDKINAKVADAKSAYATSDNILSSIDRILSVPKEVRESAHGPISARVPTLSSDTADYEALLDTLGSQAFLSQVASMKGMGQLSDAEGKKLTAGLQNLSLVQSAKQAERNVREIKQIMLKARKNMELKTGVKAPLPESKFMGDSDVAAIFNRYGIK